MTHNERVLWIECTSCSSKERMFIHSLPFEIGGDGDGGNPLRKWVNTRGNTYYVAKQWSSSLARSLFHSVAEGLSSHGICIYLPAPPVPQVEHLPWVYSWVRIGLLQARYKRILTLSIICLPIRSEPFLAGTRRTIPTNQPNPAARFIPKEIFSEVELSFFPIFPALKEIPTATDTVELIQGTYQLLLHCS